MKTDEKHPREWMYSEVLRQRPTFLTGLASVLDFAGNINHIDIPSDPDADARALALDWQAVGDAMWAAMGEFEEETGIRVLEDYLPEKSK